MEYGVDFVRLEDIKEGDLFLYMGLWRRAIRVSDKRVFYKEEYNFNSGKHTGSVAASKQFVEIPKRVVESSTP